MYFTDLSPFFKYAQALFQHGCFTDVFISQSLPDKQHVHCHCHKQHVHCHCRTHNADREGCSPLGWTILRLCRWHGPWMIRFLGATLRLKERHADGIFSGWVSSSRCKPPANVEKTLNFFYLDVTLGGNKSEWNHLSSAWHCCFADAAFSGKFDFPRCEHSGTGTLLFVYGDNFLLERGDRGHRVWCWGGNV